MKTAALLATRDANRSGKSQAAEIALKHFCLDTNVLIGDPKSIFQFEDNHVFIPVEVIEELDAIKKEMDSARGRNAREVTRAEHEARHAPPGGGEHRYGQEAAADEAEGEQGAREMPGKGLERLGRLSGTLDVGLVVGMQRLGGRHDDGEHDEVGERHADKDVEPARALLALGTGRALAPEG